MPPSPHDPEIPYPLPPRREPQPSSEPVVFPLVDTGEQTLQDSLADQRKLLVSGPLVHDSVVGLAARLMAFDGSSSRDVEISITSPGGPMSDVFPILDVLGLMRATVNVTVLGSVSGTATALVAACTGERRAAAHAVFSLRLDTTHSIEGTAADISRHADNLSHQRSRYLHALSTATGQPEHALAEEVDRGRTHNADQALALGIIDQIVGRP